jgi:hypothetical protein
MNNSDYIYIDFSDLKEDAQQDIIDLAREELLEE